VNPSAAESLLFFPVETFISPSFSFDVPENNELQTNFFPGSYQTKLSYFLTRNF